MSDCLAREAEPTNGQGLSSGALENVLQPVRLKNTQNQTLAEGVLQVLRLLSPLPQSCVHYPGQFP